MPDAPDEKKRTKKQHLTPRLHLRQFVDEADMVWTYDGELDRPRRSRVEETGAQANFYSIKLDDGSYYDELDKWLESVEDAAAAPYRALLEGEIPTGRARMDFATFVSAFYARSPALIRAYAEGYAQAVDQELDRRFADRDKFSALMDKYEADTGRKVDREKLLEFSNDKSRYWLEISQKKGLAAMSVADNITPLLFERHWYLVEAAADYFVTSDNPVSRYLEPHLIHPVQGDGGFENPASEVTIPLSPRLLLCITGKSLPGRHIKLPAEGVWALNSRTAVQSERFLYAHVDDDRIQQLASRFKDYGLRIQVGRDHPSPEVKVTR